MVTFNDWYETYERDGGEMMLFNAIDLEAAYNTGFRAASDRAAILPHRVMFDAGYAKGYEAARQQEG